MMFWSETRSPCFFRFWRSAGNASLTELAHPSEPCDVCGALNVLTPVTQYVVIGSLMSLVYLFNFDLSFYPATGQSLVTREIVQGRI